MNAAPRRAAPRRAAPGRTARTARTARRPITAAAALLACGALFVAAGLPRVAQAEELNPYAARLAPAPTDRVIVKLRSAERAQAQAADDRLATLGRRANLGLRSARAIAADLHVVRVDGIQSVGGLESAVERLRADAAVEFAEPDRRMRRHATPNDLLFPAQWYLQAVQSTPDGSTASATNAVAAWDVTTGSNAVVIAVLDTGVRFDHPDLGRVATGGKLLDGRDFVSTDSSSQTLTANDGDGWDADASDPGDWISDTDRQQSLFANCDVDESSWHGTRVAGIVAARTNNALGVAGTGWNSRVLPVRVLGKCGGYTSDIITGMRWAAGLAVPGVPTNPAPAKVLNLSLGGDGECSAAYQTAIDEIVARNVLVVVSAGNDGSTVDAPGNCRGVVAVGALRHVGNKVGFSNLGPGVTVSAPGGNCVNVGPGQPCLFSIDTTTNLGTTVPAANDYTNQQRFNVGTSFSAPIVSGIAGLMYAVNGTLTPAQVTARLRASARPFPVVAETDPTTNQPIPQCRVPTGASDEQTSQCNCTKRTCGAGLADAGAALAAMSRPVAAAAPTGNVVPGATVTLDASISSAGTGATLASASWSIAPGASGSPSLTATTGTTTSLVLPTAGSLAVQLVVTDTNGGTDTAVIPLLTTAPNLAGQSRAAAGAALVAADLELGGVTTQASASVPTGGVISQGVAAGTSVAVGTPVAIVLSSGPPPPVAVPSVTGQTQAAATTAIANAGLVLGTVSTEASSTVASGSVISQTPAAGTSVAPGTSVSLVVSTGAPGVGGPFGGGTSGGGGGGALDAGSLLAGGLLALLAGWARRRRVGLRAPARDRVRAPVAAARES
jgi:serine protease